MVSRSIRGLGLAAQKNKEGTLAYYLHNAHGDITNIVDANGEQLNNYNYDSFGNISESTESIANRFKYAGEQQDSITNLYYLRARYYNPVIGRFTQEDTYRGDGLNLYAYVGNNPVNFVDPTGYCKSGDAGGSREFNALGYPVNNRKPSINTPGLQGAHAYIDTLPVEVQREMNELGDKIIKSSLLTLAGDFYDAELIGIGYDFEDNRWISNEEKFLYMQIALIPGSSKLTKEIGEEVAERLLHETGEEFFGKGAKEAAEEALEKSAKGTGKGDWIYNKGYKPKDGERTLEGFMNNNVSIDKEIPLHTNSPGFNNTPKGTGEQFKRFGTDSHGGVKPHVHQPTRNSAPNGNIYGGTGSKTSNGGVTSPTTKDIKQLYDYLFNSKYRP